MRQRTTRPRGVRAACALYSLALRLYPARFRQAFGHELQVTFRSAVEDVLERRRWRELLAFAAHIAWDTLRASGGLIAAGDAPASRSLLGLCEGGVATGGIDTGALDFPLLCAAAGLGLAFGGWYAYFAVLPQYVS